jgi:hypothetical protein
MSLIVWRRVETMLMLWLVHACLSAAAVVMLVLMSRLLFRAATARVQAEHVSTSPRAAAM